MPLREDPIEMGFGPTQEDIDESVGRAERAHAKSEAARYTVRCSGPHAKYVREYTAEQLLSAIRRGDLVFSIKNASEATVAITSSEPAKPEDYQIVLKDE